ncbi:MAG: 23S rRNA (uracil(1939)-C(5))-methyltransferase RlmD, partial [Myxococcota bacterium]
HDSPDGLLDYRHVVKLGVGYSDQGSLRVGAWGRRSRTIVPIPHCPVTTDTLRRAMSTLAHYIIALDIRPYEPATERGVLRSIVARQSRTTGEVLITLVVGNRIRQLGELAELVANDVTEVAGVWVHINSEEGNHIFQRDDLGGVRTKPLVGKAWIEETIGGVTYRMGPGDFFQTNPAVAEVLYERTLDRLDVKEGSLVVDLYAGVGGMALQAAKRAGWALGVELVEGAVGHARESARRNGLTAEFINDEVHMALPLVQKRLGKRRPDVVVNPARRGLEEGVIDELVALNPRRIAYVSCNPWALARDLQEFKAKGFSIGDLELFNMFPNTAHVETLVVLEGPGADEAPGRAPRRKVARR